VNPRRRHIQRDGKRSSRVAAHYLPYAKDSVAAPQDLRSEDGRQQPVRAAHQADRPTAMVGAASAPRDFSA